MTRCDDLERTICIIPPLRNTRQIAYPQPYPAVQVITDMPLLSFQQRAGRNVIAQSPAKRHLYNSIH